MYIGIYRKKTENEMAVYYCLVEASHPIYMFFSFT